MGRKRAKNQVENSASIVGSYAISTGYAEIKPDSFRDNGFWLYINGVPSSHIVIGEPEHLEFAYRRWFAAGIENFLNTDSWNSSQLRVTHLGGAACSMARYLAWRWPKSRHTVVELDARLGEYVREWFDIPRSPTVKIRAGDAAQVTATFAPASRDIVIRDVFSGDSTPRASPTTNSIAPCTTPWCQADCSSSTAEHKAGLVRRNKKLQTCSRFSPTLR